MKDEWFMQNRPDFKADMMSSYQDEATYSQQ